MMMIARYKGESQFYFMTPEYGTINLIKNSLYNITVDYQNSKWPYVVYIFNGEGRIQSYIPYNVDWRYYWEPIDPAA